MPGGPEEALKALRDELEPWIGLAASGAFDAVPFGYSVQEVIYRPGGVERVSLKPMHWFTPQRDGRLLYRPATGEEIEVDTRYKFLLARRNPTWLNPYGEALLSRLYWLYLFRHNGGQYWVQFLERFGLPLILGQVHATEEFVAGLQSAGLDSVVAVGPDEKVSAVQAVGTGEFERFEIALSKRVQRVVLGQTLTSDVDGGGSYAAAKVHDSVRTDKRNADLRMVTRALQPLVAGAWWAMGFQGPAPRIVFEDDTGLETARADRDARLVSAGIVELKKDYLLRVYDFEEGDFDVPEKGGQDGGDLEDLAAAGRLQLEVPDMAGGKGDAPQPISPLLILSAVRSADSPQALEAALSALAEAHDGGGDLAELMERALFLADIYGYSSTEPGAADG
jgi:phage gp29-like protein